MNNGFRKRTYKGIGEFGSDLRFVFNNITKIGKLKLIPSDFTQRLMLSVISVYGCRYCSFIHTRDALRAGINKNEIDKLLAGTVENCPEEEAIALVYAQHWADSNADPDPEAVKRLVEYYGSDKTTAINMILRMIRIGNLLGNSWDYLLYRLFGGRWRREGTG
jgi:AhpD family alkylhydroperoxidase